MPKNNILEEKIQLDIYCLMDSFLVEAKDQNGNERSLERLNQDRHLFVKNILGVIHQFAQEITEAMMVEEKEQLDKNDPDNYGACYAIAGFNDCLSAIKANRNSLLN